jgi:hypothetical protein
MVTGLATAAVQVAVTCVVGEGERWTEGSLAVQFEFARAGVIAIAEHPLWLLNRNEALKIWLLAGAAAIWSAVPEEGVTFKPVAPQSLLEPPQPAMNTRPAVNSAHKNSLHKSIVSMPFLLHNYTICA